MAIDDQGVVFSIEDARRIRAAVRFTESFRQPIQRRRKRMPQVAGPWLAKVIDGRDEGRDNVYFHWDDDAAEQRAFGWYVKEINRNATEKTGPCMTNDADGNWIPTAIMMPGGSFFWPLRTGVSSVIRVFSRQRDVFDSLDTSVFYERPAQAEHAASWMKIVDTTPDQFGVTFDCYWSVQAQYAVYDTGLGGFYDVPSPAGYATLFLPGPEDSYYPKLVLNDYEPAVRMGATNFWISIRGRLPIAHGSVPADWDPVKSDPARGAGSYGELWVPEYVPP